MAKLQYSNAIESTLNLFAMDNPANAFVAKSTKSIFKLELNSDSPFEGYSISFNGKNLKYSGGTPSGGKFTSIIIKDDQGREIIAYDDLKKGDFNSFKFAFETLVDRGLTVLLGFLSESSSVVSGSKKGEMIFDGGGKQKLVGKAGDDMFMAYGGGADIFDGGSGHDVVDYNYWIFSDPLPGNIVVDFKKGTVRDATGATNKLKSIEAVRGTEGDDIFKFKGKSFIATGNEGADSFDGGGANNRAIVAYQYEADWGGNGGIVVDLGAIANTQGETAQGTITDAFGDQDLTFNIRIVTGTNMADSFTGSYLNDIFNGMDGMDSFDGDGGNDIANFNYWYQTAPDNGINVDLSLNGGEIIDDGFGNTENATSIEGIMGTDFADSIKGDDANNFFEGLNGKDTLEGKGGADYFVYGRESGTKQFGDTILDFVSGEDKLVFYTKMAFAKLTEKATFKNGSKAKKKFDAGFFFDADTDILYYDKDGWKGKSKPIAVVELAGIDQISKDDLIITAYGATEDWWV